MVLKICGQIATRSSLRCLETLLQEESSLLRTVYDLSIYHSFLRVCVLFFVFFSCVVLFFFSKKKCLFSNVFLF